MEFSYESSPALARLAARRFIQRRAGAWLALFGVAAIAGSIALAMGFRQWYVIAGVVLSCGFLLVWLNYYAWSDRAFRSMPDPNILVRIKDDSIEFVTSEQSTKLKWSRIKQVWKFRDVWLLFTYTNDSFTLIPAEALTDESEAIIEKKVIDNGGSVT